MLTIEELDTKLRKIRYVAKRGLEELSCVYSPYENRACEWAEFRTILKILEGEI